MFVRTYVCMHACTWSCIHSGFSKLSLSADISETFNDTRRKPFPLVFVHPSSQTNESGSGQRYVLCRHVAAIMVWDKLRGMIVRFCCTMLQEWGLTSHHESYGFFSWFLNCIVMTNHILTQSLCSCRQSTDSILRSYTRANINYATTSLVAGSALSDRKQHRVKQMFLDMRMHA